MIEIPNLRHLRVFLVAARVRRLGRAAVMVHLSQPAATQAIRKLEAHLGHTLFERTSVGLNPTEAGTCFQVRIERAFRWLDQGQRLLGGGAMSWPGQVTRVQLRALISMVQHGGYGLAARRLGLSQPGLHRAVRELEAVCGQRLFLPTPQGVEATAAARELARLAALALAEIVQGMAELRERQGILDGRVWVGCLPLARTRLLPDAVTHLLNRYPDVKMRIVDGSYGELLQGLRHGQIDMIVGALREPAPFPDILQEALFTEPLSIVVRAGHPILAANELDAACLSRLAWVVPREGTPARDHFEAFFRVSGVEPPQRLVECSSMVATRALLLESDRAGMMSQEQVRYEVAAGFLAVLPKALQGTERPIGLTVRSGWQPTIVQARMMSLLRDICRSAGRPAEVS